MVVFGKRCEWPSRQESPRTTSIITAGSVRGKCCVLQAVQLMALPALRGSQTPPQTPQNRCLVRQCIKPRAWASTLASPGGSSPATWRRSAKTPNSVGSRGIGSSAVEQSTAKTCLPSHSPNQAQGPPAIRSAPAASPVSKTAWGAPSATPRIRLRARQTGAKTVLGSASAASMKAASSRRWDARSSGLPV